MKNSNSLSHSIISNVSNVSNDINGNNNNYVYDEKLCMDCIDNNFRLHITRNCPHCGSENYDTGCIPAITQQGKSSNCISSKDYNLEQAYRVCKAKSSSNVKCHIIEPESALSYQKKECGDDYYCSYDFSNQCSYNVCNLKDDFIFGQQSNCACQKIPQSKDPHGILKSGQGIECIKGNNCLEYTPTHSVPDVQHTDPQLIHFYSGYNTYMDFDLTSCNSTDFINRQIA